jgi:hypothetical protein
MRWVALIALNWIVLGFIVGALYGQVVARHQVRVDERRQPAGVMVTGSPSQ